MVTFLSQETNLLNTLLFVFFLTAGRIYHIKGSQRNQILYPQKRRYDVRGKRQQRRLIGVFNF